MNDSQASITLYEELLSAAESGNIAAIEKLCNQGVDLNSERVCINILHAALIGCTPEQFKHLLSYLDSLPVGKRPDVNKCNSDACAPLVYALELLLSNMDEEYKHPAFRRRVLDNIKLFLQWSPLSKPAPIDGRQLLLALDGELQRPVSLPPHQVVNICASDENGRTALQLLSLIHDEGASDIIGIIKEKIARLPEEEKAFMGKELKYALLSAAQGCNVNAIFALLSPGPKGCPEVDVNGVYKGGNTALHCLGALILPSNKALRENMMKEAAIALLEKGADPQKTNAAGRTATQANRSWPKAAVDLINSYRPEYGPYTQALQRNTLGEIGPICAFPA